jgi:hypothetical protein
MTLTCLPYDAAFTANVRADGPDANGQPAERAISTGRGTPCRSCLRDVPEGAPYLILAARPFPKLQPYAETGPIFLCADECAPWTGDCLPPTLQSSPDYLLKGYDADDRIVDGSGRIVESGAILGYAEGLLSDPRVTYVDVRSARNNCFLTRIVPRP